MQVSSSYLPALPIATDYGRGSTGYAASTQSTKERPAQQQTQGEITRIRARASVRAQVASQNAYSDNISARNRSALQTYQNNGPSIEERLGVELAGIDVYA